MQVHTNYPLGGYNSVLGTHLSGMDHLQPHVSSYPSTCSMPLSNSTTTSFNSHPSTNSNYSNTTHTFQEMNYGTGGGTIMSQPIHPHHQSSLLNVSGSAPGTPIIHPTHTTKLNQPSTLIPQHSPHPPPAQVVIPSPPPPHGSATFSPPVPVPPAANSSLHESRPTQTIVNRRRPTNERSIIKLTVHLMETYSAINERYYAGKRKKMEQQQAAAAAAASTSHSSSHAIATPAQPAPPLLSAACIPARKGETNDGYSDRDWNYIITENELLSDSRYQVIQSIGKGSFGRVVKAWDHRDQKFVAVKIVKAKSAFYKQAQIEMKLLTSVNRGVEKTNNNGGGSGSGDDSLSSPTSSNDTESPASSPAPNQQHNQSEGDRWNIVCMLDHFMHHNHQCIVFELLSLNLYELLRNTRFTGISLKLIGKFAHQLLMTLAYLSCKERGEERIIHCDLKPENILLRNSKKSAIKVIDLGSACFAHEKVYTYIQSRFYRAPEVILGVNYNAAIDMWSLGCICFELSLGTPLFDGQDEHDQIIRHVDLLGIPPAHMIEKSKKGTKFFEASPNARTPENPGGWQLRDPAISGSSSVAAAATYMKLIHAPSHSRASAELHMTPLQKLQRRLAPKYQDTPIWNCFCDLIMKMLEWDPKLRIKPAHAITHQFFDLLKKQAETSSSQPITPTTSSATSAAVAPVLDHIWNSNKQADVQSNQVAPLSTIFSHAAAAAFTYQPPLQPVTHAQPLTSIHGDGVSISAFAQSNPTIPTISSFTAPHQDTIMADSAPASNHMAPMATTAMPIDSHPATNGQQPIAPPPDTSAAMEVDEVEKKLPISGSKIGSTLTTPTRKRHSETSIETTQGTPKTRAAAAAAAASGQFHGRQLFQDSPRTPAAASLLMQASPNANAHPGQHPDREIEYMQLPQMAYQSPSIKPVNRSTRLTTANMTQSGSFIFGQNSSTTSSTTSTALPPRRGSDNGPDSSVQLSPPHGGVLTRAQKSALQTPPFTPSSSAAAANFRQLASDPISLHLSSVTTSPPQGPQATPHIALPNLALFASPERLRRQHRTTGMSTRRQLALAESTAAATVGPYDQQASDEDDQHVTSTRSLRRTRANGGAPAFDLNDHPLSDSSSSHTRMETEEDDTDAQKENHYPSRRTVNTKKSSPKTKTTTIHKRTQRQS